MADHLTKGGNLLKERLEGHVLLGALGLEGGEGFGKGGEAIGVILCVVGAMVAEGLHVGAVPFVVGILLNPEAFVGVPWGEGRVGVEAVVVFHVFPELASTVDCGQ